MANSYAVNFVLLSTTVTCSFFVFLDYCMPFLLIWSFFTLIWRCQVIYQKWMNPEKLNSECFPTFWFALRIRRDLIFGKLICCNFGSVVFQFCQLIISRFSWLLLAFFAKMIFIHFDLTPLFSLPEIDESRECLIWSISYGQIGFDKFFKCKILICFLILGFFHY